MRPLKRSFGARLGAGKRAALVPEQRGLDQGGGDGGRVEGDKRAVMPPGCIVQTTSRELLAGARLAEDQHRGVVARHPFEQAEDTTDLGIASDEVPEALGGFLGESPRDRIHDKANPTTPGDIAREHRRGFGDGDLVEPHGERARLDECAAADDTDDTRTKWQIGAEDDVGTEPPDPDTTRCQRQRAVGERAVEHTKARMTHHGLARVGLHQLLPPRGGQRHRSRVSFGACDEPHREAAHFEGVSQFDHTATEWTSVAQQAVPRPVDDAPSRPLGPLTLGANFGVDAADLLSRKGHIARIRAPERRARRRQANPKQALAATLHGKPDHRPLPPFRPIVYRYAHATRGLTLVFHPPRSLTLDGRLGRGGFGEVYRGRLIRDRLVLDVAVKVLHQSLDPRGQGPERLRDEARFLGRLRHRTVPHVHDLAWLDGHLAFLVEYIDGIDLSEANARRDLPRRAAFEALADVADALDAAWNHIDGEGTPLRLVHRDLKPGNIRLGRDGAARLLDFGIARSDAFDRSAATALDAVVGTPAWMAPERFDRDDGGPASDAWALAAVMWETLVGQRLWHGRDARALMGLAGWQDRYDEAIDQRLNELPSDVPAPVRAALAAGLRWSPKERPSAAMWSQCLRDAAATAPGPGLVAWCRQLPHGGTGEAIGRAGQVYEETTPGVWIPSASAATTVVDPPRAESTHSAQPEPIERTQPEPSVAAPSPRRQAARARWGSAIAGAFAIGASGAWLATHNPSDDLGIGRADPDSLDLAAPLGPVPTATSAPRAPAPPARPPTPDASAKQPTPTPYAEPKPSRSLAAGAATGTAAEASGAVPARGRATGASPPVSPTPPVPTPVPRAEVRFSAAATAAHATLLDDQGARFVDTGRLPTGTYKLVASLDGGAPKTYVDGVHLPAESTWEVHCDAALRNCALRPARTP